ncbi:MAG TPA: exonuclease domain-containing protein [Burkholderiaceae bacterium]|nr:exonuclease domain-containing protein [Burkholderiaceae bacterium]
MTRHGKLLFVDLETTGANPVADRITEIGIVEVDGEQVTHWSTLVNPQVPIPSFIQNLTGITGEMVRDAPTFAMLCEEVLARLQDGLFIAHNARFDYGFLRNAFKQAGRTLRSDVLCTVKLSRNLFPQEAKHNLDALIARHRLVTDQRHRALADADLLWQFWRKMQSEVAPEIFDRAVQAQLQRPSVPAHLEIETLEAIPETPGVYVFYGESDAPLYVGKSVHLRQRVLSHVSADHRLYKDMQLSQQIRRLEWHETAGEIGALLLEARLVKELQPIHNRALRRQRELCAWQLRTSFDGYLQPVLAYASEQDFGRADRLYGLFNSRRKAETALRELAESHELCLVALGLEHRTQASKPCFAYQLHRCRGACTGAEPIALHQARLEASLASLKVKTWPYPGTVGLVETAADGRRDVHVVRNWCCLGTARSEEELWNLLDDMPTHTAFELDTYKILVRALTRRQVQVRPLHNGQGLQAV